MANSYTLAGTAKSRGLGQVNPRLVEVVAAAAARSPYQVQIFSGKRGGSVGGSRHNSGNALDIALIDPTTGQVIPNYKSSTGFPIYAEFAKIAREEQMRLAPELADQFRWGGGFSDKDFDLMHFDLKPGGAMAYWTWEDGGKLTPAGAAAVPKFGPGWVYANGERQRAPEGQYASLWGREPLQAPQDAQSAIAGLVAPSGGPSTPDMPTAAMGYAPNLPADASFGSPMPQVASAPPPLPSPPPSWASGGFGQDTMLGGTMPPLPRMRDASALGQQRADQLDAILFGAPDIGAGPGRGDFNRMRPEGRFVGGGAPDASAVPDPISRRANGVLPPPPLSPAMPNPTMRPEGRWMEGAGGAPGNPPNPPPRGTPYAPDFPSLYGEQPSPPMPGLPPMVAGRPEFPGMLPAASRSGDLSAAMGNAPQRAHEPWQDYPALGLGVQPEEGDLVAATFERDWKRPPAETQDQFIAAQDSRVLAREMMRNRQMMEGLTAPPPAPPAEARAKDDTFLPPLGPSFSIAAPGPTLPIAPTAEPYGQQRHPSSADAFSQIQVPPGWQPGGGVPEPSIAFNPPSDQAYRWFHGYSRGYTGEGGAFPELPPLTPPVAAAPPMPAPLPGMTQDQFNISFSPGGPGMIADLSRPPPPSMTGQDAINQMLGPGSAMGAMPFMPEGFDSNRPGGMSPPAVTSRDISSEVTEAVTAAERANGRPFTPAERAAKTAAVTSNIQRSYAEAGMPLGPAPAEASPAAPSSRVVGSPADAGFWNTAPPSDLGLSPLPPLGPGMQGASAMYGPLGVDPTFAGGSVVPKPGDPGVVQGQMPTPEGAMSLVPEVAGGPKWTPPSAPPAKPPRQANPGAERERAGLIPRILGGLLGGPVGALGGGLLGGMGGSAMFSPVAGSAFTGINASTGRATNGMQVQSGNMTGPMWNRSGGGSVGYVTDPFTGAMIYSASPTGF